MRRGEEVVGNSEKAERVATEEKSGGQKRHIETEKEGTPYTRRDKKSKRDGRSDKAVVGGYILSRDGKIGGEGVLMRPGKKFPSGVPFNSPTRNRLFSPHTFSLERPSSLSPISSFSRWPASCEN